MLSMSRTAILLACSVAGILQGANALPSAGTIQHVAGAHALATNPHALRLRKSEDAAAPMRLNGGFWKPKPKPKPVEKSKLRKFLCTAAVGFIAGAIGGLACDVFLWPIETVKTRLQTGGTTGIRLSHPIETLTELFEGCYVAIVFAPIFWGLFFAAYEPVRNELVDYFGKNVASYCYIVSAAIALTFCFIVRVPVEIIKTRMMTGVDSDFFTGFSRIIKSEGFFGLYRGFWSLGLREFPFTIIEMVCYENLRGFWASYCGKGANAPLSMVETSVIGSMCDAFSGAVTNPFDVVKSRLMNHAENDHGMIKVAQGVYEDSGFTGFMDGGFARTLWMGFGGLIFWPALEWAQEFFSKIIN